MEILDKKIRIEKNILVDHILAVFAVLLSFTIGASLYRAGDIGMRPIMWLHIFLVVLTFIFTIFKRSIIYRWKVGFILLVVVVLAICGLIVFGFVTNIPILCMAAAIIATTFMGMRAGIIFALSFTMIFITFGILVKNGLWDFEINADAYLHSLSSWILLCVGYLSMATISVLIVGKMNAIILRNLDLVERQKKELEIANSTKDKLFSVIAHDLKIPFCSLIGFMQMFCDENENFSDKRKIEIFEKLLVSSEGTLFLLENLLAWSQSQINETNLKSEAINVKSLFDECVAPYVSVAEKKEITINQNVSQDVELIGDAASLRIILCNLISNAIKFTSRHGHVTMTAMSDEMEVTFCVADSGIGMDDSMMKRVLDSTDHISTLGTDRESGTGLGVGLCQELVNKNKGKIWVKSVVGEGSSFFISFPKEIKR